MTNFTDTNINIKLDTLSKIWDDKKALSIRERNTKQALFLELESDIKAELIEANGTEEIDNLYKQIVDVIENMKLFLDSKKDIKKIAILDTLIFVAKNRIKIYLYTSKGTDKKSGIEYMLKLTLIQDLMKWEISKSQISKAKPLYGNDDKNNEYSTFLVKLIDDAKKAKFDEDTQIAINAGVNGLTFNDASEVESMIRYLSAKLKTK